MLKSDIACIASLAVQVDVFSNAPPMATLKVNGLVHKNGVPSDQWPNPILTFYINRDLSGWYDDDALVVSCKGSDNAEILMKNVEAMVAGNTELLLRCAICIKESLCDMGRAQSNDAKISSRVILGCLKKLNRKFCCAELRNFGSLRYADMSYNDHMDSLATA